MPDIQIEAPSYWPELRDCAFKGLLSSALEPAGGDGLTLRILHQGAENPDRFYVYVLKEGADGSERHVYSSALPALSREMLERPHEFEPALMEAVQGFVDDIRQDRLRIVQGTADQDRERAIAELSQKVPF